MSHTNRYRMLLAALCTAGLALNAAAADRSTPREARALFDQAVKYMEANGPERAFAAFNNQKGQFVRKDLYVFALDDKGTYHASGAAPEALVGLNVIDTVDAAGKPLFREMLDSVKAAPEGSVRYVWLNRATNKVEPKVSYVRKVGDYVVGVGYSVPRSTADDARRMLDEAVKLVRDEGTAKAAAAFNDRGGKFVHDDLYVFMVDLASGRFEAMGMNPQLAGSDASGLADAEGHAIVGDMIAKSKARGSATVDYVWRNPVTNAVEKKRSYVKREGGVLVGVGHYLE